MHKGICSLDTECKLHIWTQGLWLHAHVLYQFNSGKIPRIEWGGGHTDLPLTVVNQELLGYEQSVFFTGVTPKEGQTRAHREAGDTAQWYERWLLFQRTWVGILAPAWQLATISSSRNSDALSWPPKSLHVHRWTQTYEQAKHPHTKKNKK